MRPMAGRAAWVVNSAMTASCSRPPKRRWAPWFLALFGLGLFATELGQAAVSITLGSTAIFDVNFPRLYYPGKSLRFVISAPVEGATYQWLHNDAPIAGATSLELTLPNLSFADNGNYAVNATKGGKVETSNTLVVNVVAVPPSSVDTTFTAALPAYDAIPTLRFIDPLGRLVVQGSVAYNPVAARLNLDGSADSSFSYPPTAGVPLAGYADGSLIMNRPPYRLNPDGSPRPLALPAGFDATANLAGAAIQPDGKVLLVQYRTVARLNADDSVDSSFVFPATPDATPRVTRLQFDQSNRIYVTTADGFEGSSSVNQTIYRLGPNGMEDNSFQRQTSNYNDELALYPLSDGRLLRRTRTTRTGSAWAMLKDNGTVDPAWSAPAFTGGRSFAVDAVNFRVFFLGTHGIQRQLITATTLIDDQTFYQGDGQAIDLAMLPSGKLLVQSISSAWDGHPSRSFVRLRSDDVTAVPASVSLGAEDVYPTKGSVLNLTAEVIGSGPLTYQWLALDGQPLPANSTSATLTIPNVDAANLGRYQVRVTGPGGTVLSNVARVGYIDRTPYLSNLSGRAFVGTGDDTAIAGFSLQGTNVSLLLRGAGPALQGYGVGNFLPNPVINLYSATNQLLRNNDNWYPYFGFQIQQAVTAAGAFPFAAESNDAALITQFSTGNATLQLTDISGNSGVGLLEIYRLNAPAQAGDLTNLSLRARTAPGEKVATAGFVVVDPQGFNRSLKLLLRVVGPKLSQYGVAFPLADPVLTLRSSTGAVVATNDNWSDQADPSKVAAAAAAIGAFALDAGSKDASLLLDVPAGVYSIQATGAPGTPDTGVTLIEIYVVR